MYSVTFFFNNFNKLRHDINPFTCLDIKYTSENLHLEERDSKLRLAWMVVGTYLGKDFDQQFSVTYYPMRRKNYVWTQSSDSMIPICAGFRKTEQNSMIGLTS